MADANSGLQCHICSISDAHLRKLQHEVKFQWSTRCWRSSFLTHSSDVNDLLEGLDGVLKDWLDRLHDTESSLHIVDLWLHAFDGLHLSGNFNEWLSVIESLQDSGGKGLLDVLDGSGLGNSGITVSSGF